MAETYTSGVATLKELANAFQRKASSDLEEINSTISLQATAVENVRSQRRRCIFFFFFSIFAYVGVRLIND